MKKVSIWMMGIGIIIAISPEIVTKMSALWALLAGCAPYTYDGDGHACFIFGYNAGSWLSSLRMFGLFSIFTIPIGGLLFLIGLVMRFVVTSGNISTPAVLPPQTSRKRVWVTIVILAIVIFLSPLIVIAGNFLLDEIWKSL